MSKVEKVSDAIGNIVSILKIKDITIEKNEAVIKKRLFMVKTDKKLKDTEVTILLRSIERLRETNDILKLNKMKYKFRTLLIYNRMGALAQAQFDPKFLNSWKLNIESTSIPPTVLKGIDKLEIIRPYDHIRLNDLEHEKKNLGSGLLKIVSIRIDDANMKQEKEFIISYSFVENIQKDDTEFDKIQGIEELKL